MKVKVNPWNGTKRSLAAVVVAVGLSLFETQSPAVAVQTDVRRDPTVDAVEKVMPSVVNIAVETLEERSDSYYQMLRRYYNWPKEQRQSFAVGSGVIIDEDGYLITNYHVVEHATRVQVKLSTGEVFDTEPLLGTSQRDIVLLKIKAAGHRKFQAMKFAQDDDLLLGETVIAIGNPYGLGGSVTRGILSSKNRRVFTGGDRLDVPDWLQTDADINPGNSGGPLVNLRGELIGLNVAVHREDQGMGVSFAIPVRQVNAALAEFFNPEALSGLWFGARAGTFEAPLFVSLIQPRSPADQAGLRAGHQILKVNGVAPRNLAEFERLVSQRKAGDNRLVIEVDEKGERRSLPVQLLSFDALTRQKTGVVFRTWAKPLTDARNAMVIESVEPGSPADRLNLRPGFIVTALDDRRTSHVINGAEIISTKKPGERLKVSFLVPSARFRGRYEEFNTTLTLR